ncbi:MAG: hypothetical protein HQK63_10065 [Desulfamplus sp.]|nr:hypothetical protein [Desulfamplus sp.]
MNAIRIRQTVTPDGIIIPFNKVKEFKGEQVEIIIISDADVQLTTISLTGSLKKKRGVTGKSLLKYAGLILPDDLRVISDAVKNDCGRVDNNEW